MKTVDIVIPVFNEGQSLESNLRTIRQAVCAIADFHFQFIIINDGSTDDSLEHLIKFCEENEDVQVISLTRNFGKEAAILAGLEHSQGDAVIVMDSDLQHPPELISKMAGLWLEDIDVVAACKSSRGREAMGKRFLAGVFYRLFELLAGRDLTNHSDFKLLDRKVVDAYLALPERKRFFRGLVPWMGFSSAQLYFDVPERPHGQSGWSSLNLFRFSIDALTGFTSAPLYLIIVLGLICFAISLIIGGIALYYKFNGLAVSGFTTVILLILLIGSFIMFGLGLIGVYMSQIFKEVKNRPIYLINERNSMFRDQK